MLKISSITFIFCIIVMGIPSLYAITGVNDSFTVNASIRTILNVIDNDIGPSIIIGEISTPLHGTAVANDDGTINYTSTPGFLGNDSFTYTLTDSGSLYFNETGHYYEFVSASGITWQNANSSALNSSLSGLNGYLATITSAAENDFVKGKLSGQGWMGAGDVAVEGQWKWITGPEAGTQFWQGASGGSVVGGLYNNWASGEPNDWGGSEDFAHFLANGQWNDYAYNNGAIQGYVVEYGGLGTDNASFPTATVLITVVDEIKPDVQLQNPANGFYNDTAGSVNVTFNCSAIDNNALQDITLYITTADNDHFGASSTTTIGGTTNSSSWTLELTPGNYTWNCVASDSITNLNWSTANRTLSINFTDSDRDGIADYLDHLYGNDSNLNSSGIDSLNITIGNTSANGSFDEVQEVIVSDGDQTVLNFSFNFTANDLNLSQISIEKGSNYIIVNLSGQLQNEFNKTIYIEDNNFIALCVKDAEISEISNIGGSCSGVNETDFSSCINGTATINGITCVDNGDIIVVSNLRHSAIEGTPGTPTVEVTRGGRCTPEWQCTNWTACFMGNQSRVCTDPTDCYITTGKPNEVQNCTCIENWTCSVWSACTNAEQSRTCIDNQQCGTSMVKPVTTQHCETTLTLNITNTTSNTSLSAQPLNDSNSTQNKTTITIDQSMETENTTHYIVPAIIAGIIIVGLLLFFILKKRRKKENDK